jgi:hypothetical protein
MLRQLLTLGLATTIGCSPVDKAREDFQSGNYTHLTAQTETTYTGTDLFILQEKLRDSITETWQRKSGISHGQISYTDQEAQTMLALYNSIHNIDPETAKRYDDKLYVDTLTIKLEKGKVIKIGETELLKTDSKTVAPFGYRITFEDLEGNSKTITTFGKDNCGPKFKTCKKPQTF